LLRADGRPASTAGDDINTAGEEIAVMAQEANQVMKSTACFRIARIAFAVLTLATIIATIDGSAGRVLSAAARQDFGAVSRYVFVPSRSKPTVTVIEQDKDQVVGTLDSGLIPEQVVVSEATAKLVAIDGAVRRISSVDLKSGRRSSIDLDFVPQRLVGSADGNLVVAANFSTGTVAFIELMRGRVVSQVTGLPAIRDLMLGSDGAFLYVAADRMKGVGVIDVARGRLIEEIPTLGIHPGDIAGLTRSPNGRLGYAKARNDGAMTVLDLSNFRSIRKLNVGRDSAKAFPTGFGGYLVVPDNTEGTVMIVANSSLSVAAMLKGVAGMTTVYSGWFDTLALVPSSTERKLLIYDLDQLAEARMISLPAKPGAGAVTPEGTKLYLALNDTGQVAVIDLQTQRLTKTIEVGSEPGSAIMARSFDICH
jgi:YVTN family beta-propeller protein